MNSWYLFNDDQVKEVEESYVFNNSIGGKFNRLYFDYKDFSIKRKEWNYSSHAYMLVYLKKEFVNDLLLNISDPEKSIPLEIRNYVKEEREQIDLNRFKKENLKIYITTHDLIKGPTGRGCMLYTLHEYDQRGIFIFTLEFFDDKVRNEVYDI